MTNDWRSQIQQRPTVPEPEPKKRRSSVEIPEPEQQQKANRIVKMRLLPIWLRLILIALLFISVAVVGLIVGYGYIGDGDVGNALKWSTWQYLLDIIEGKE